MQGGYIAALLLTRILTCFATGATLYSKLAV
jgi:hypothetical protein